MTHEYTLCSDLLYSCSTVNLTLIPPWLCARLQRFLWPCDYFWIWLMTSTIQLVVLLSVNTHLSLTGWGDWCYCSDSTPTNMWLRQMTLIDPLLDWQTWPWSTPFWTDKHDLDRPLFGLTFPITLVRGQSLTFTIVIPTAMNSVLCAWWRQRQKLEMADKDSTKTANETYECELLTSRMKSTMDCNVWNYH